MPSPPSLLPRGSRGFVGRAVLCVDESPDPVKRVTTSAAASGTAENRQDRTTI